MSSSDYMPPEDPAADAYEYEEPPAEPPPPVETYEPPPPPPPPPPVETYEPPAPAETYEPPPAETYEPPPPPPPVEAIDAPPPDLPEPPAEPAYEGEAPSDPGAVMGTGQPGAEQIDPGLESTLAESEPLEPSWAAAGEPPFPVSEPEVPFSSVVRPGQPLGVYWGDQSNSGHCTVCSSAAVVSELSGTRVDPQEVVSRAADNGWLEFGESGEVRGTPVDSMGDLLGSFGVASQTSTGEADALDRLEQALVADRRVVLPLGQPGSGPEGDVTLAVSALDREGGVVSASDSSANPPLDIPLSSFEEAWRESDFALTSVESSPYDVLGMTMSPTLGLQTEAQPLADRPEDGQAALGDWWAAAGEPTGCCTTPGELADAQLGFTDSSGASYELPGLDTSGSGRADLASLDANGDGLDDTWLFDTTDSGQADLLYYDSTGNGVPDSVSCCGESPGAWTDPLPLSTALNQPIPGQQPAPLELPVSAFPAEVQNQLTIMPDLTLSEPGQPEAAGPTLSIMPDLTLSPQEPAATGVPTISIDPSIYMLENDGQANALSATWGDHWRGADEYTRGLMESVLSPSPRSANPQLTFPNSSMAQALSHISNASSAMLAPTGMEYRWNQSTGSTNLVSRGSMYP